MPLENPHEIELVDARVRDLELDVDEREGRPSRWNTLRAMRVLDWYEPRPLAGGHRPWARSSC